LESLGGLVFEDEVEESGNVIARLAFKGLVKILEALAGDQGRKSTNQQEVVVEQGRYSNPVLMSVPMKLRTFPTNK